MPRDFEGWSTSTSSFSEDFFRLPEDGERSILQFMVEIFRLSATRLGDPEGDGDGDPDREGQRVNAGVGGNEDCRNIEEHVREQIAHTANPHFAQVTPALAPAPAPDLIDADNTRWHEEHVKVEALCAFGVVDCSAFEGHKPVSWRVDD